MTISRKEFIEALLDFRLEIPSGNGQHHVEDKVDMESMTRERLLSFKKKIMEEGRTFVYPVTAKGFRIVFPSCCFDVHEELRRLTNDFDRWEVKSLKDDIMEEAGWKRDLLDEVSELYEHSWGKESPVKKALRILDDRATMDYRPTRKQFIDALLSMTTESVYPWEEPNSPEFAEWKRLTDDYVNGKSVVRPTFKKTAVRMSFPECRFDVHEAMNEMTKGFNPRECKQLKEDILDEAAKRTVIIDAMCELYESQYKVIAPIHKVLSRLDEAIGAVDDHDEQPKGPISDCAGSHDEQPRNYVVDDRINDLWPRIYGIIELYFFKKQTKKIGMFKFIAGFNDGDVAEISKNTIQSKFRYLVKVVKPFYSKEWYDRICATSKTTKKQMTSISNEMQTNGWKKQLDTLLDVTKRNDS